MGNPITDITLETLPYASGLPIDPCSILHD